MKSLLTLYLLIIVGLTSCKVKKISQIQNKYQIVTDDDGILVEKFDSSIVDDDKYNHNNIVYKAGNKFKYKYEHITLQNEIQLFKITEGENWEFIDKNKADATTEKYVEVIALPGNPMSQHIPDYNQTAIVYKNTSSSSMTGVIENEANVWVHPPRYNYFRILELNPFPYIKAPYEVGTKWTWNLRIGDQWADERWKIWEGSIENKYNYEITDIQKLETVFGKIKCYVIESSAKSRIGETMLTAYFNEKYGFVKLNYTNINGTKTNIELIEFKENETNK